MAWTIKNIKRFGGDPNKVYVSGHSAGGYLTSMVGLDKRWLAAYDVDADQIAGLIPLSGHTITHMTVRAERGISDKQPIVDEFAPLYHVRPDAPPIFLMTGDREKEMLGRYEENAYFMRMLKVVGHKDVKLIEVPRLRPRNDKTGLPGVAEVDSGQEKREPRKARNTRKKKNKGSQLTSNTCTMTMTFLKHFTAVFFALLTLLSARTFAAERPNVLFILTDDQRWDELSCAGHPFLKTPNIDRLADEGARFANAFVTTSPLLPLPGVLPFRPLRPYPRCREQLHRLPGRSGELSEAVAEGGL